MARGNRNRRQYDRVKNNEDDNNGENDTMIDEEQPDNVSKEERITVIVMDPAQKKFEVSISPEWNVSRLKKEGVAVHKIAEAQQRLIYMGRMLADDTVLKDAGITKPDIIIHLFPKPRVVVCAASDEQHHEAGRTDAADGGGAGDDGAHVPRIVLDEHEAEMRTSILVLGSAEIMEAQNNVKLLSFLLLVITSMELLALFTIMLGVPSDASNEFNVDDAVSPNDDLMHPTTHDGVRHWRNSDYFDLALNIFGFYSAMLGIRATTENTRRVALRYLLCTILCGVAWTSFYYYLNYSFEEEVNEKRVDNADDDNATLLPPSTLAWQAFFAVFIPIMIWLMCCFRAFQFHALLQEAEQEAEERIRNELNLEPDDDAMSQQEMALQQTVV